MFALGNKTYEHYNAMGKYVDKRLEELGATRIFDLGMGDDDGKYVVGAVVGGWVVARRCLNVVCFCTWQLGGGLCVLEGAVLAGRLRTLWSGSSRRRVQVGLSACLSELLTFCLSVCLSL